jgi:hypothetical protein
MSELDVQKILTEAASVHNVTDKRGKLKTKATRWLRKKERESKEEERDRIKAQLSYTGPGAGSADQKANAAKWMHHLDEDLEDNSPPPLTKDQQDAAYKREQELTAFIKEGMLTQEEMRRNPVSAVDRHMKWEAAKKSAILEWKNLRILLNAEAREQDLANVETLRPSQAATSGMLASSSFMPDAQIPGVFGMTPLAKQNWPEGMPEYGTANSALAQAAAKEQELAEREAKLIRRLEVLEGRIASEDAKKAEHARKCKEGLDRAKEKRNKAEDRKMQKEIDRLEAEKKAQAG